MGHAVTRFNAMATCPQTMTFQPTTTEAAAMAAAPLTAAAAKSQPAVRMFGRFQLVRLLGKSQHVMAWLTMDRSNQEFVLVIPRIQLQGQAMQDWQQKARRAARLNHPHLAQPVEVGEYDRWPFAAYERGTAVTWAERFSRQGIPAQELAAWAVQAAQGLAYAHEAGVAHRDLQPFMLSVDEAGQVKVLGLDLAGRSGESLGALDELRAVRDAAVTDVLALGVVMHHGLAGQPALEQADVNKVIALMPPLGQDFVRLPWTVPRPIPDPLRAIVNRATDRQVRQRYRNARTLQRALEGWIKTSSEQDGGPLALLLDRLRTVGVLPALPGAAERVAHLALMDRGRTSELAEAVLDDMALTFELMRMVNSAQVHGASVSRDGPVLMLRRAIAMLGLEGVRRAALGLRAWPGPMSEQAAEEMLTLIKRVQRASQVATRLVPAGYDGEVVSLITQLQNLGRLMVQYHFPEEAMQIRRLMQSVDAASPGGQAEPGMSAEAASYAVLGIDVEALGVAVAKHWGLDETVQTMIRRLPPGAPVHHPDGDNDILRVTASCANDLVDVSQLPAKLVMAALGVVARRYARPLGLTAKDMQDALQSAASEAHGQPASPVPSPPSAPADASAATRGWDAGIEHAAGPTP
jgi:eukaryotic-like serine/threonine-protein kinase